MHTKKTFNHEKKLMQTVEKKLQLQNKMDGLRNYTSWIKRGNRLCVHPSEDPLVKNKKTSNKLVWHYLLYVTFSLVCFIIDYSRLINYV